MKCANCEKYVERHNLKDAQFCLEIISKKITDEKNIIVNLDNVEPIIDELERQGKLERL